MKILVTGGAGYIGSFMTKRLLDKGEEVAVLDNLQRGHKEAVDQRASLLVGDLLDTDFITKVFTENKFDAILHFAGLIAVGESEQNPELYHQNNVVGSKNLFETAIKIGGVKKFIFSSSAAVYGNPTKIPIPEDHSKGPTSKYGENKLEVEKILESLQQENQELGVVCLRYFNAAGAALDGSMGEQHIPETHIIPNIIKAAVSGTPFKLFGDDYKTKDGSCVRDYIHVLDLVEAHLLALGKLEKDQGIYAYNVGTGNGYSNKEVVDEVKKISGKHFDVEILPRRPGDPDELIADSTKIREELNFSPKYSDIETIVSSAWKWQIK